MSHRKTCLHQVHIFTANNITIDLKVEKVTKLSMRTRDVKMLRLSSQGIRHSGTSFVIARHFWFFMHTYHHPQKFCKHIAKKNGSVSLFTNPF